MRDSENLSRSYWRPLRHSRQVQEMACGRGITWPFWDSMVTISYRSFWQARVSGVTPGANCESSMEWSKMASEKERTSTLLLPTPFSWSSRSSSRFTTRGWLVSTATSSASWICRKSNFTACSRASMVSSLPRRIARLRASLHSRSSESSSCRRMPSGMVSSRLISAAFPSCMTAISSGGKRIFLFMISRHCSGCRWREKTCLPIPFFISRKVYVVTRRVKWRVCFKALLKRSIQPAPC
ncbi:hypothetical protein ANANG_G00240370 [Anguilla anguilla]|uniref:Uncharacterized protein n=1 Tax=Anguilla anguilla TaxID=7936 RepID=A0A9D3RNZ6_ANGAN|nr:hypothetical protein ANANG_G00240370 [Anguilla anguilla]